MNVSARITQDHNWWHTKKSQVNDLDAQCRIVPENDDSEPYACDGCGDKVLELYAVNGSIVRGMPLKSWDYVCKECVEQDES